MGLSSWFLAESSWDPFFPAPNSWVLREEEPGVRSQAEGRGCQLSWFKVRRVPRAQTPSSEGAGGSGSGLVDPKGKQSWGPGLRRKEEEGGGDLTSSASNEGMRWGLLGRKEEGAGGGSSGMEEVVRSPNQDPLSTRSA